MSFEVTARTILHLGADLITSDAVALYELIKNSIDARSTSGVDVDFEISIRESDYSALLDLALNSSGITVLELQEAAIKRVLPNAPQELKGRFIEAVNRSRSISDFVDNVSEAYRWCNRVVIFDQGHGMSLDDLRRVFFTIGTTSRAKDVSASLKEGNGRSPYLGEKGVGRLSAMRLGRYLSVETATANDVNFSVLNIDWRAFEEAYDKPISSVKITPEIGGRKEGFSSYTKITISDIVSSWSYERLIGIARAQIARMMDPFSWSEKRRFQIRLRFNGVAVEQVRVVARGLLDHAHATCTGEYTLEEGAPKLRITLNSKLYEGPEISHDFDLNDLLSLSGIRGAGRPSSVLRSLGPFDFEFFWFNRQRLRAIEGVGDREAVRSLVKAWGGICLFRDGYRVLPYGDEGDDWLGLDREALGASGYKLNTKQLIGRVRIGRAKNPKLLDQTNRQGLKDCPEKEAMIQILNVVVARWWHDYLNDSGRDQKKLKELSFDSVKEVAVVDSLEQRTKTSLKAIRKDFSGDARLLEQVKDAFLEIKDAHARAVQKISNIEEEKERLTQLAGVGLMIEVIAHELTRATELTQATLKGIDRKKIDDETSAAFRVLGEQIKVIQKRLHTLEPLSVSARQRRSMLCLNDIVKYVLDAHGAQFLRHSLDYEISALEAVKAFVVEGHVVQILENLISNTVYWAEVYRSEHSGFVGKVKVEILDSPPRIRYSDNGPGIPAPRAESVFEPFYSTKNSSLSRRQGLGLYIARQNAELLGGSLMLVDEGSLRSGRFNIFELELKESAE
ncbi:sensor histidine kinase [Pseudomonas aeruginosa]|uniref:sensor histidine kinase n=1 Tax=Pseudomonas aeruginosa TaxID=287 RepID=UPI000EB2DE93|nr:ATP-binding protein [Pseudomonas aeruginosa]